jgi:predicted Zn-dependent protease
MFMEKIVSGGCRMKKKFLIAALGVLFSASILVQPVYAVNWGAAVANSAAEYAKTKKELNYFNTDGSAQVGEELRSDYGVDEDAAKNELLDNIMIKLTSSIKQTETISPEYSYFVNQQTSFNAFCALGHNVSVNTGLFDELQNDEDEIGFVLAHELVHGQKNHMIKELDKLLPANILKNATAQAGGSQALLGNVVSKLLVAKQATLPGEWEADNVGFTYAVNAGFNPGAGAAIWARVLEKYGDNHQNFLGEIVSPNDHPTNGQRIANYTKKLTEYSKGNVVFDKAASCIMVKNKVWFKVAAADGKSATERGFLIAGKLAKVFHDAAAVSAATEADGWVLIGEIQIVNPTTDEDDAATAVQKLNAILGH